MQCCYDLQHVVALSCNVVVVVVVVCSALEQWHAMLLFFAAHGYVVTQRSKVEFDARGPTFGQPRRRL